jgi:hypothetical protein
LTTNFMKLVPPLTRPRGRAGYMITRFFALLNVAVDGTWPGSPDGKTVFPQTMAVDYVRVYSR